MPVKISQLPAATALGGTEQVPMVQGGVTVQGLVSAIGTYVRALFTTTPATIAEGGTGSATAATARTALGLAIGTNVAAAGANTDITSLNAPALGAATATTQTTGDNTTKVSTTAFATATAAIAPIGIVASARSLKASIATAATSATFTADEVVLVTTLAGASIRLGSYSKVCNLATTGAGGMDTGAAPANGFVSIYAIYNPTTVTASILACAVATSSGSIYAGVNMPAGYTYSALLAICPTNGTPAFAPGLVDERRFSYQTFVPIFTAHAVIASLTSQSISGAVPAAATRASLLMGSTTTTNYNNFVAAGDGTGTGGQAFTGVSSVLIPAVGGVSTLYAHCTVHDIPLITAQTVYIAMVNAASASTNNLYVSDYML